MSTPEEIVASTAPAPRGSKLLGFGLAWFAMITGTQSKLHFMFFC